MKKTAFAVAAHPDDIEFMMAGTLLALGQKGYQLHYMNVANGSCGAIETNAEQTISIRTEESKAAAELLGAVCHSPLVDDLKLYYTPELVAKLCAVVRQVAPEILLIPSPVDYMEDHTNTSRLMVTAAFCRGMPNFMTDPPSRPVQTNMAVYHALPYGLQDPLRNPVTAQLYIDVADFMDKKTQALACHKSQKEWLDKSQGHDSYLKTMQDMTAQVGRMSGTFQYAEGWQRRSHFGFGDEAFDPLSDALSDLMIAV